MPASETIQLTLVVSSSRDLERNDCETANLKTRVCVAGARPIAWGEEYVGVRMSVSGHILAATLSDRHWARTHVSVSLCPSIQVGDGEVVRRYLAR